MTATLEPTDGLLASVLPMVQYFEIDSEHVGARFGVWVTVPLLYDREDRSYPMIMQTDGNKAIATTGAPYGLLRDDPINPIEPFIQVCVGYLPEDAPRMLAIRARDLLPPGEPLPKGADESMIEHTVASGMLNEADARLYLHYLRNPRADNFLAFLVEELSPAVRERFRVSDSGTGLHGFSYGGLFASYAALSTDHFDKIGAGSPGITKTSKVLDLFEEAVADSSRPTTPELHVTVCERELTYPSLYQPLVGIGSMMLVTRAGEAPVKGMKVTSALTPTESHATGSAASFWSFLRQCYSASEPTSVIMQHKDADDSDG